MRHAIIKIKDLYFLWSVTADAPASEGMTADQLREHIRMNWGLEALKEFPEKMDRVEKLGTSILFHDSVEDTLAANRAGADDETLTADDIYDAYYPEPVDYGTTFAPQTNYEGVATALRVQTIEGVVEVVVLAPNQEVMQSLKRRFHLPDIDADKCQSVRLQPTD